MSSQGHAPMRFLLIKAIITGLLLLFCHSTHAAQRAVLLLEHGEPSAWNNLLISGLEKGGKDFKMETEVIIAPKGQGRTEIFRNAAKNADLVLVASDGLHEVLRDNAANFRRVKFGSIDAGIRAPNIMSVTFADEQASYLAGAASAIITKERKLRGINGDLTVGWLSGEDTPAMRTLFSGFAEGAKLDTPETRVIQAVAGSFTDAESAAAKAAWLLDAGADVIALAAGAGNEAALRELAKRGAWHIALDAPENAKNLLATIVKKADKAVYEIMASAASEKFAGKEILVYDLANGGVELAGIDAFMNTNGKSVGDNPGRRVGELARELKNGAIRLHSLRARTLCDCLD